MVSIIYSTVGNFDEAKKIALALVNSRLAACVNIIPKIYSIYRWKEKVEEADEWLLLVKTSDNNIDTIITRIKEMHSYELPAIVVLPVEAGLKEYLTYIEDETL